VKKLRLILLFLPNLLVAQAFIEIPIEGTHGKDYSIVNYVDWKGTGFMDAHCGTKSYDGHQGTDFVIESFKSMDSGFAIKAAAAGIVTSIKDGEFDRETSGTVSKNLGNYIAIKHYNTYYTYYAHLKKNSLLVKPGDSVKTGQTIAQVGSSGNSTDPHLHFELWYDSTTLVDPFSGSCGNAQSLWINEPKYDTTFWIWDSGISDDSLSINKLRERQIDSAPFTYNDSGKAFLNLWAHLSGVRKNDELRINWIAPNGNTWFSDSFIVASDFWYYYYWSNINHKNLAPGNWNVHLSRNDTRIISQAFTIDNNLNDHSLLKTGIAKRLYRLNSDDILWLKSQGELFYYALDGRLMDSPNHIASGNLWIVSFTHRNGERISILKSKMPN